MAVERVNYNGWRDALRLHNGIVEAIVVPSVGRVMRFGFVGGPNLLWENKTVAGKPIKLGEWANTGGDKVWVWPQDDWPKHMPNDWPPPAALDQAPHQAEILGDDSVQLTSSLVIGWGLRCERLLVLAPTTLVMTSVLRKVRDGADFPVAPWTVTQVSAAPTVWARKRDGSLQAHKRDPKNSTKTFFDADVLAHVQGDTLLSVRMVSPPNNARAGAAYARPTDRAQVYCNADDPWFGQNGMTSYTELEFTAPLKTLKRGEDSVMVTALTLDKLDPNRPLEPQIAGKIR